MPITDAGVKDLAGSERQSNREPFGHADHRCRARRAPALRHLKKLLLTDTPPVSDAGMKHLRHAARTWSRSTSRNTPLTDAGLKELTLLTGLQLLDLAPTPRSPTRDSRTLPMQGIETFDPAQHAGIGDAGLKDIAKLTSLKALDLSFTRMGGRARGSKSLRGCSSSRRWTCATRRSPTSRSPSCGRLCRRARSCGSRRASRRMPDVEWPRRTTPRRAYASTLACWPPLTLSARLVYPLVDQRAGAAAPVRLRVEEDGPAQAVVPAHQHRARPLERSPCETHCSPFSHGTHAQPRA